MNQHVAIEAAMDADPEFREAADNVVTLDPPTELERHAALHRRAVERYEREAAEALENGKRVADEIKQQRKLLHKKYQADLSNLKGEEASHKAFTVGVIHTKECLAAISDAAVQRIEAALREVDAA